MPMSASAWLVQMVMFLAVWLFVSQATSPISAFSTTHVSVMPVPGTATGLEQSEARRVVAGEEGHVPQLGGNGSAVPRLPGILGLG